MHDRDGRAPVALAGDQPVAQLVVDGKVALAPRVQPLGDGAHAVADGQAVELAGVDHGTVVDEGLGQRLAAPIRRGDDGADFDAVAGGEVEVAPVVGRHGHDGPRAVGHQHVVGDPDGQALVVDRVDGVTAGEDAGLVVIQRHALQFGLAGGGGHVGLDLNRAVRRRNAADQRMLRRQHHEGGTE